MGPAILEHVINYAYLLAFLAQGADYGAILPYRKHLQ
jgi:hypothetical protein